MTARRKRGERRRPTHRLRLQERDVVLARFVGRAGVVELPSVALPFWGTGSGARSAAARRLRALTDDGLIATHVDGLSSPNRYTLTDKGAAWVGGPELDGRVLRTRVRAYSATADHLVASAGVWAAVAHEVLASNLPRMARFITEAEVRRACGKPAAALIPDGIALFRASLVAALAIEVDMDHERPNFLAAKFRKYRSHLAEGAALLGLPVRHVLVVAPSLRRVARIALVLRELGLERFAFFQLLGRVQDPPLFGRVASFASLGEGREGDPFVHPFKEVLPCT